MIKVGLIVGTGRSFLRVNRSACAIWGLTGQPRATRATPAQTSVTPAQRAELICS
jgi:hypothetical protein